LFSTGNDAYLMFTILTLTIPYEKQHFIRINRGISRPLFYLFKVIQKVYKNSRIYLQDCRINVCTLFLEKDKI